MIGIIIFVFFGALSLGMIGGVIFGIIRAITLHNMQRKERRQRAEWEAMQAQHQQAPWVPQIMQQPWAPPQQPYYGPDQP